MTSPAVASPAADTAAATCAAVNLLAFAGFFSGAALRICDGLLPRLGSDFGVTAGVAGRVVLTFAIAYGISQLLFGPLGDRYGKARVMCASLFASALGALACAMAPDFSALVRLRIFWGISAAGVIPLAIAWIGDAVPYEQRQATLARLLMGTLSGMTAGQLGGGLFADSAAGWRGAFGTLCAGYVVVGLLLLLRLRSIPSAPPVRGGGRFAFAAQIGSVLAVPWARVVVICVFTEGIFLMGPLAFLPSYLHQHFGLALATASGLIAMYAFGGLLYALVAQHVVRRLGERRMVQAGGTVMGLAFLALYATPVAWAAAPIALVLGFGTYLLHNTLQTNATQMAPEARGLSMSLFAFALFSGQSAGVALAAPVMDRYGGEPIFLLASVIILTIAFWFRRQLMMRMRTPA